MLTENLGPAGSFRLWGLGRWEFWRKGGWVERGGLSGGWVKGGCSWVERETGNRRLFPEQSNLLAKWDGRNVKPLVQILL